MTFVTYSWYGQKSICFDLTELTSPVNILVVNTSRNESLTGGMSMPSTYESQEWGELCTQDHMHLKSNSDCCGTFWSSYHAWHCAWLTSVSQIGGREMASRERGREVRLIYISEIDESNSVILDDFLRLTCHSGTGAHYSYGGNASRGRIAHTQVRYHMSM